MQSCLGASSVWDGMAWDPSHPDGRGRRNAEDVAMDVIEDYLRDQAVRYRELAACAADEFIKKELIELASVCEEVANDIGDRLASG